MSKELTGAERRYLLKKVKADIQSGNATTVAKLTMLYDLEKKLTAQQAQKPEPEDETGFVFQQVSQTLKIVADELKLANSRLGWKDSQALTRALEWQRKIVLK